MTCFDRSASVLACNAFEKGKLCSVKFKLSENQQRFRALALIASKDACAPVITIILR